MRIHNKLLALLLVLEAFALGGCDLDGGGASLSSAKAITSFYIPNLTTTVTVDEDAKTVEVAVQWNAGLVSLAPIITHTGASIDPASGVAQDFSSPVTYTVTALDGTTREYTVTVTVKEYALRETGPAGGWVFYINPMPTAWKYLEAAPESSEWNNNEWGKYNTLVGGTGTAVGTGADNTALIVAVLNQAPAEADRAAQLCVALGFCGYGDWFLPSKDELNKMWVNLASGVDENSVSYTPVGGFGTAPYWSSSEQDAVSAYSQSFADGGQGLPSKVTQIYVRAIRAF